MATFEREEIEIVNFTLDPGFESTTRLVTSRDLAAHGVTGDEPKGERFLVPVLMITQNFV